MNHECFVCSESHPPLMRFCKCRNMLAHRPCMSRIVESVPSHRDSCPVCETRYEKEVQKKTSFQFRCHYILLLDAISAVSLVLLASNLWKPHVMRYMTEIVVYAVAMFFTTGLSTELRCAHGILFPFAVITHGQIHILSRPATPDTTERKVLIVQCV